VDSYLRDTLLVLSSEKNGPGDATGVLALKEEGLGLAILEAEDLAVTTDVELALFVNMSANQSFSQRAGFSNSILRSSWSRSHRNRGVRRSERNQPYLSRVDLLSGEGIVVGTHVDCCVKFRRLFSRGFEC
jgi:hypothetical protein